MTEPKPIEVAADTLDTLPIMPPRRRFRDLLPMALRKRIGLQEPSPRELWYIQSAVLRMMYAGLYAQAEASRITEPALKKAGKEWLN